MKWAYAILVIVSFLNVALFGFAAMDHQTMQAHRVCLASLGQSAMCPETTSLGSTLGFHFQAFKGFVSSISSLDAISALLLLVMATMAMAYLTLLTSQVLYIAVATLISYWRLVNTEIKYSTLNWLTLFEKRAPAASF